VRLGSTHSGALCRPPISGSGQIRSLSGSSRRPFPGETHGNLVHNRARRCHSDATFAADIVGDRRQQGSISMRRTLRSTVQLLVPGITLFVVLLIGSIVVRSLPVFLFVGVLFYGFGLIPIAVILAIAAVSFFYWRRHWLSGFSLICAVPLVFAFGFFPHPINSPVGWAANVLKVIYYHTDLQRSYVEAKKSGQTSPVG
jgi:hypothetical protein